MGPGTFARTLPVAALLALVAPHAARAQLVIPPAPAPRLDSHPVRLDEPETPKKDPWTAKAELSYVSTSGNADTTTARVASEVQYVPGNWTLMMSGAFLTSTSDEEETNHRIDGLARASRTVSRRLELFGQLTYLRNTFAGLDSSVYPLGGFAYTIVDARPHRLTARAGLGYGQESRVREPDLSFATADAQAGYRWSLSKAAEFREEAVYTRNLSRPVDWRLANVTSIAAAINSMLSLKVSHSVNYYNQPVSGFEKVDSVTSAAVVATF